MCRGNLGFARTLVLCRSAEAGHRRAAAAAQRPCSPHRQRQTSRDDALPRTLKVESKIYDTSRVGCVRRRQYLRGVDERESHANFAATPTAQQRVGTALARTRARRHPDSPRGCPAASTSFSSMLAWLLRRRQKHRSLRTARAIGSALRHRGRGRRRGRGAHGSAARRTRVR